MTVSDTAAQTPFLDVAKAAVRTEQAKDALVALGRMGGSEAAAKAAVKMFIDEQTEFHRAVSELFSDRPGPGLRWDEAPDEDRGYIEAIGDTAELVERLIYLRDNERTAIIAPDRVVLADAANTLESLQARVEELERALKQITNATNPEGLPGVGSREGEPVLKMLGVIHERARSALKEADNGE